MFPPPPAPIRPARGLAVTVTVVIVINLIVEAIATLVSLQRVSIITDVIENPLSIDLQAVEDNDTLYGTTGLLQTATFLIAGVCYWIWLFRVRANAEVLAPMVPQRRARPWLIFGWFVPIVSFWFPKQIIDDIWTASDPQQRRPGGLAMSWWIVWLLSVFGSNLVGRLLLRGEELEELRTAAQLEVVLFPLTLVAGVLAIVVVNKITALQAQPRPAPVYPNPQYPGPQYPGQQYPGSQYPAQQYPGQQYPGEQYPQQTPPSPY
ncbi:DUF4328 domain-containing protein [Acrocarpospora sp. B8E8]|uniref:DUF4328 domain-containing protein n=1 Tax=Acrocarpospora sp. B8E8 TaxID=3153572 RepID=UPI00325CC3C2